MVEKRMGIGTTVNMAHPVGKVLGAFLALALVGTLLCMVWLGMMEATPIRVYNEDGRVICHQLRDEYVIEVSGIKAVSLVDDLDKKDVVRSAGTSMPGLAKGRFIVDHSTRSILEVPEKQMDAFIKVVTEYPDTPVTSEFPITKGTRVRVVRGPLKGIEGEVEETPNGVQLIVAIQSLICTRITIGRGDVVAIDTP